MTPLPKRQSIVIGAGIALIVLAVFFGVARYRSAHRVPQAFVEARDAGGKQAQEITDLSKKIRDDLERVRELESAGKSAEALTLLGEIEKTNTIIRTDASELSSQLTKMAEAVNSIGNKNAQPLAFDAIRAHLTIVARVVNYNDDLGELVELLTARAAHKPANQNDIDQLVRKINTEVEVINGLNTQATEKLTAFDETIRSGK